MTSDMDFDFRLGLIVFFGGLWIYLLRYLKTVTSNDPTSKMLIFVAFLHFVVLAYLCLSLFSFYSAGVAQLGQGAKISGTESVDGILFGTWPIVLIALALSFVAAKLELPSSEKGFLLVFYVALFVVAGVAYLWLLADTPVAKSLAINWKLIAGLFVAIPLAFLVYLLVLSCLFADATITTDKEVYKANDPVYVWVNPTGYLFRPHITRIRCNLLDTTNDAIDRPLMVPPDKHLCASFIQVNFEAQAIPLRFERFHRLRIVPTDV